MSKPTWPYMKMNCSFLLNHERTVINHIILEKADLNFTRHTQAWLLPDLLNQEST